METPRGSDTFSLDSGSGLSYNELLGPAVHINGRKVLGPPENWLGPPPANTCELFIKKIPRHLAEECLIPHLQRFGQIYEFRLMMEFNECNRGFGFVKYTNEEDANRAMEVLNHFYVTPGRLLEMQPSYDKCRLFVGNLPKSLTRDEIEQGFREVFPNMEKIVMHNRIIDGNQNRGFVFIDFPNHQEALFVKKQTSAGRMRKWGRDLKIVWANPERLIPQDMQSNVRTLFIRNVDLSVTTKSLFHILVPIVPRTEILKISRVREFAFVDFATRAAAETALDQLQGIEVKGYPLHFEWALPPSENSVHTMKNFDFDAVLRLKCIANYWHTPIIIFGRVFDFKQLQYAAIMIRRSDRVNAFFFEIQTKDLSDIQARLCEVLVNLIEKCKGLPMHNYVIKVKDDSAHIVGAITELTNCTFVKANKIKTDMFLYWDEIYDLCKTVVQLSQSSQQWIYTSYVRALTNPRFGFMQQSVGSDRILGCLNPNYRQKPPLKYQIDNTQIIFVLCSTFSYTNYQFPNNVPQIWNLRDDNQEAVYSGFFYTIINLLPAHFAQSKNTSLLLNAIHFGYFQPGRAESRAVPLGHL